MQKREIFAGDDLGTEEAEGAIRSFSPRRIDSRTKPCFAGCRSVMRWSNRFSILVRALLDRKMKSASKPSARKNVSLGAPGPRAAQAFDAGLCALARCCDGALGFPSTDDVLAMLRPVFDTHRMGH